jgi:hypothetical protein
VEEWRHSKFTLGTSNVDQWEGKDGDSVGAD